MRGNDVKKNSKKSNAKKALNRPQPIGWASTDEDEIVRRRLRGQVEITKIEAAILRGERTRAAVQIIR